MLGADEMGDGRQPGMLYVRVMRTPSAVLYNAGYQFEYGKAWFVHGAPADAACIVSTGRGVHEAIAAARECAAVGVAGCRHRMPSIDEDLLLELGGSGKVVCVAEQNNGYILQNLLKVNYRRGRDRERLERASRSTRSTARAGRSSFTPGRMRS